MRASGKLPARLTQNPEIPKKTTGKPMKTSKINPTGPPNCSRTNFIPAAPPGHARLSRQRRPLPFLLVILHLAIATFAPAVKANTITLTADSTGHVWANKTLGWYNLFTTDPHAGDESLGTSRGCLGFPITASQLNGATVNSVTLHVCCAAASSSGDYVVNVHNMRTSNSINQDVWNDAGDGTTYCSSVAGRSTGWQTLAIFSPGPADLQTYKANGETTFPLGLAADGKSVALFYGTGAQAPYLVVDYTPAEYITAPNFTGAPASDVPVDPGPQNISITIRCPAGSSSYGHTLQYQLDFGDGTTSSWLSSRSTTHTYSTAGSFPMRARARCATHTDKVSDWSGLRWIVVQTPVPSLTKTLIDFGTGIPLSSTRNDSFGIYDGVSNPPYNSAFNNVTTFTWTASDNQAWLTFSPSSGSCTGSGTTTVSVTINTTGLSYDTLYSGTITVVPTYGANITVTVQFRTQPHTVSTPNTPSGPSPVATGSSQTYSTGGAACSVSGHSVQYCFDWGDGSHSPWSSSTSASHSWTSAGTYQVRTQARCAVDNSRVSAWSGTRSVVAVVHAVSVPSTPSGPSSGYTAQNYTFSSGGSSCPLGHTVEYHFSWGDGATSPWSSAASASHAWTTAGTFSVAAQARCAVSTTILSAWSPSTSINIVPAPLPYNVRGMVRDTFAGGPLPNATVQIWQAPSSGGSLIISTNTDSSGHFTLSNIDPANWNIEVRVSKSGYTTWFKDHMNPAGTIYESVSLMPNNLTGGRFLEVVNGRKDVSFEFPPDQPNSIILHNNRDLYLGIEIIRSRTGQPDVTLLDASNNGAVLGPKRYWVIPSPAITVSDPGSAVGDTYRVRVLGGGYDQPGPYDAVQKRIADKSLQAIFAAIISEVLKQVGGSTSEDDPHWVQGLMDEVNILWVLYNVGDKVDGKSFPDAVVAVALYFGEKTLTDKTTWAPILSHCGIFDPKGAERISGALSVAKVLPRAFDLMYGDTLWGGSRGGMPRQQDLSILRANSEYIIPGITFWNEAGGDFGDTIALPKNICIEASFDNCTGRTLNNTWALLDVFDPSGRHLEATKLPVQDSESWKARADTAFRLR